MNENRQKALEAALSQIEKQFGKGSIMRLGEQEVDPELKVVSPRDLSVLILLLALVGCLEVGLLRFTVQSHLVRLH